MVTPKDNFLESYSEEEVRLLKSQFDIITDYAEKIRLYSLYFSLGYSDFAYMVGLFHFPFPIESQHSISEVESLDKLIEMSTVEWYLTTSRLDTTFSILPANSMEWSMVNRYIIDHYFPSLEKLKELFWEKLEVVPEQAYFIQSQIDKFAIFEPGRNKNIPFYREYYEIPASDKPLAHLNRWYPTFDTAFSLARKEGIFVSLARPVSLSYLYFSNLGYIYAHYLGFLKKCLAIAAQGNLFAPPDRVASTSKDKLTHKAQVLLLHKLGILDLPAIARLNDIQKGKLLGYLLNRNEDNTENYIRYRHGKNVDRKYSLDSRRTVEQVDQLFQETGYKQL